MSANYCQRHKTAATTDTGECYFCAQVRERKAEQDARVADLLASPPKYMYDTWGWEQTNVTFYRVTRVTAKCLFGIKVEERRLGEDGFMTSLAVPTDETKGKETRLNLRKLDRYTDPVRISWYG